MSVPVAATSVPSDAQRTLHAGDGVAAEPDGAVLELDGDLTVTTKAAALSGRVRARLQHAVPTNERRHAPVALPHTGSSGMP